MWDPKNLGHWRAAEAIKNRVVRAIPVKASRIRLDAPIASFTFDDFAKSALAVGGTLVEAYGGRATYYVAGGLCGGTENGTPCYDEDDLISLVERGHEIGCHTFDHLPIPELSPQAIEETLAKNTAFLSRTTGQTQLTSFSYPFGRASLRTKQLMASKFLACRGIYPGINGGWTDISQLNAICLHRNDLDLEKYVKKAREHPGWLIFIGHDVSDSPSFCGCTPKLLEHTLRLVSDAGIQIVTIGEALQRIFPSTANKSSVLPEA